MKVIQRRRLKTIGKPLLFIISFDSKLMYYLIYLICIYFLFGSYQNMEMDMERMPCVVHTLQLVVHMLNKEASVKRILDKA